MISQNGILLVADRDAASQMTLSERTPASQHPPSPQCPRLEQAATHEANYQIVFTQILRAVSEIELLSSRLLLCQLNLLRLLTIEEAMSGLGFVL